MTQKQTNNQDKINFLWLQSMFL